MKILPGNLHRDLDKHTNQEHTVGGIKPVCDSEMNAVFLSRSTQGWREVTKIEPDYDEGGLIRSE